MGVFKEVEDQRVNINGNIWREIPQTWVTAVFRMRILHVTVWGDVQVPHPPKGALPGPGGC